MMCIHFFHFIKFQFVISLQKADCRSSRTDIFQFFLVYTHKQCVKCDTNLHADDFQRDYTQLIDGDTVAPETTLGDVIWLSRYQTLKHIPVVNLLKWAFTEDIQQPRALTGNERQAFSKVWMEPISKQQKAQRGGQEGSLCWRVSLFTDLL